MDRLIPAQENANADSKRYQWPQLPKLMQSLSVDEPEVCKQSNDPYQDQNRRPNPVPLSVAVPAHGHLKGKQGPSVYHSVLNDGVKSEPESQPTALVVVDLNVR